MNLDQAVLGEVMIHDVPHGGSDDEPTLTNAPVQLDAGLRAYFLNKLTNSLKTRGVDVVANRDGDSTVCTAVARILLDRHALAVQSRQIATRLAAAQNGHNSAGLLTVIAVDLGGQNAVAVMKLEREQGIRFDIDRSGRYARVNLELLRQLTLTNKTKVFKTALLCAADPDNPSTITGRASDNQRGITEGQGVADFFLGTFLGCTLALNPAHTTKQFVGAVTEFVNDTELGADTRGRYTIALLSELHNNREDIAPRQFVAEHIAPEHRPALLDHLRDQGIDPATGFQKDTSLIRYDKIRIRFESGILVVGNGQDVRDHVRIRRDDEPPGADINDVIRNIAGR